MKTLKTILLSMLVTTLSQAGAGEIVIEGAIAEVSKEIGNLVHLKWSENRLTIDREHWKRVAGDKTEAEKEQDELDAMIERGIPADIARRMMLEKLRKKLARGRGRMERGEPPETELFDALTAAAGAGSRGRSGGSNGTHYRGESETLGITMFNSDKTEEFRFVVRQKGTPFQQLIIEDDPDRGLRIQLGVSSQLIVFSQIPNGTVRVAQFHEGSVEAFSCPSYDEMVIAQPEFSKKLESVFEQLKINKPLSNFDPRVVEAVATALDRPSPEVVEAANQAIATLGSREYQEREAAQEEVGSNADLWQYVIQQKLADPGLDIEVETRLKRAAEKAGIGMSEEEVFIKRRKLLQDSDYLSAILPRVSEAARPSVQDRIDELRADR